MNSVLIFVYILSIVIASYSQVLLKKGAMNTKNIFINKYTIIGYFLMIISTLFSLIGYNGVSMNLSQVLQILGFFFISLFSHFILHEEIEKNTKIGLLIIIIGIVVYSL